MICEATPTGEVYSDEKIKNVNLMTIRKDASIHPMNGGVAVSTSSTFSYGKEGYYDNINTR